MAYVEGESGGLRDYVRVGIRRVVMLVTCAAVAALAAMFAVVTQDQASWAAGIVSALTGVGALGVAVWMVLPGSGSVRVSNTGSARSRSGGLATSGFTGRAELLPGRVEVSGSGDADAAGGGTATTGVNLT